MSVIVKGMKLPDYCAECELNDSDDDGIYCTVLEEFMRFDELPKGRREDCPLTELIPCVDCKYWDVSKSNIMSHTCHWGYFLKKEDDYCSWAKPKEEESK